MAQTLPVSPSDPLSRFTSVSPRTSRAALSASISPPPFSPTSSSPRASARTPSISRNSESKENVPVEMADFSDAPRTRSKGLSNDLTQQSKDFGNGGGRTWRDGSVEVEDGPSETRHWKSNTSSRAGSVRSGKSAHSPTPSSPYNGLPTLETVPDDDVFALSGPSSPTSERPPPPASSTLMSQGRAVTRKRRSSSIKRKPSPGVVPQKAVDWEIPRKALHSSIGLVTLFLWWMDPPSVKPLITVLSLGLATVTAVDVLRLNFPAFAEIWEAYLGFLMRESERDKINGVIWYLVGVIFVLALYPRDVAVVSILTLSWSDTTASTLGRLWGRYTPPLPAHVPGIKFLPFAPRKSLAGFLAATVTGILICLGFWRNGSGGHWHLLDAHWLGLLVSSVVIGIGGAVTEALDLGLDDNLTLPILSGALIWAWLSLTNLLF